PRRWFQNRLSPRTVTHRDCSGAAGGAARFCDSSLKIWLGCGVTLGWLAFFPHLSGQALRLEIEPEWQGNPVVLGETLSAARVSGMSLSRVDGLLSRLALRRADGSWLE